MTTDNIFKEGEWVYTNDGVQVKYVKYIPEDWDGDYKVKAKHLVCLDNEYFTVPIVMKELSSTGYALKLKELQSSIECAKAEKENWDRIYRETYKKYEDIKKSVNEIKIPFDIKEKIWSLGIDGKPSEYIIKRIHINKSYWSTIDIDYDINSTKINSTGAFTSINNFPSFLLFKSKEEVLENKKIWLDTSFGKEYNHKVIIAKQNLENAQKTLKGLTGE